MIKGMEDIYELGTVRFFKVPGVKIAGKTGTAENYVRIDGKRLQLTDHSMYVAFAPSDNPKIALSVLVENGHYGAIWAARIASLMIEKYLNGEITRTDIEDFILNGSLEHEYEKPYSDQPFLINQ